MGLSETSSCDSTGSILRLPLRRTLLSSGSTQLWHRAATQEPHRGSCIVQGTQRPVFGCTKYPSSHAEQPWNGAVEVAFIAAAAAVAAPGSLAHVAHHRSSSLQYSSEQSSPTLPASQEQAPVRVSQRPPPLQSLGHDACATHVPSVSFREYVELQDSHPVPE